MRTFSGAALQACLISAAAFGSVALMSGPEVKAACIGSDNVCTTFDPSTPSTVQNASGFSGSYNQPSIPLGQLAVLFDVSGYAGPGFQITDIFVSSSAATFDTVSLGSLSVNDGLFITAYQPLSSSLGSYDLSDLRIDFTLPGSNSINGGTSITAAINLTNVAQPTLGAITSVDDFTTSALVNSVPAPLPLLGAGAAFGFSRKLRRRVAKVK